MREEIKKSLREIKARGLYRALNAVSSAPEEEMVVSGRSFINFSSNNYLGLANCKRVKDAGIKAAEKYGCSGTSSRLVAGNLDIHAELEEKTARFKNKEAALAFPSGFQANCGIISALLKDGGCIIMDKLNHASLWDAAKLTRARIFAYEHRDMNMLEKVLKRAQGHARKLVVTDSLFSMDGDFAPLKEIIFLAKKYNAWSMIDEAHATGVFGKKGRGLAEYFDVEQDVDIVMGTYSKALGCQGGFVCGSKELVSYLINKSRSFIYTTALSPFLAGAGIEALKIIDDEPERRNLLLAESVKLREGIKKMGFDILSSESQIVPVLIGSVEKAAKVSRTLYDNGIYAPAIRPPTVPEGRARLRFSVMSTHKKSHIDKLLKALRGAHA
jgi:8-amino-7-oxononanoate synthase